jgi:hypothetical protein
LLQWCDVIYPQKGQGALDHKGGKLVAENFTMGQIFEEFFKKEGETNIMDGRYSKLLAQIGSHGVLWIPSITNVLLLLGGDN